MNNTDSTPKGSYSAGNSAKSSPSTTATTTATKPQPIPTPSSSSSSSSQLASKPLSTPHSSDSQASSFERKNRHSRQSSATLSPSSVFPAYNSTNSRDLMPNPRELESRGRRSSSTSSSASAAHLRNSIYQASRENVPPAKMPHQPGTGSGSGNVADVYDQMEKEQEAMVNKLQREIHDLKRERSRSRSQSTSSSASVSRNASMRSVFSDADERGGNNTGGSNPRMSRASFSNSGPPPSVPFDDQGLIQSLRKENESLKKKLADLSIKCKCHSAFLHHQNTFILTIH